MSTHYVDESSSRSIATTFSNTDSDDEFSWKWPVGCPPKSEWIYDQNKTKAITDVQRDFRKLSNKKDYYGLASQVDFLLDNATIVRYIEAFQWVQPGPGVKTTAERMVETIEWRQSFALPLTKSSYPLLRKELKTGKNYTFGKCKLGRPIVYLLLDRENTWDAEGNSIALIYTIERAIATMDNNVQETVYIIDCNNIGFTNGPTSGFVTNLVDIFGKHYPRRNGKIFICNVNSIFYFIWNIISLTLSDVAKSKIVILNSDQNEMRKVIGECVDVDLLLKQFGGNKEFDYDVDRYLTDDPYLSNYMDKEEQDACPTIPGQVAHYNNHQYELRQ